MAKDMLEYEEEELRQLEKMYKADDLGEETEAIVLKRARDSVKRAKFGLEMPKSSTTTFRKFSLPRQEERIKEAADAGRPRMEPGQDQPALALSKHRLEVEKLKIQRAQAAERLNKLIADRAAMTVKAPCDGIVYYGKCVRGKWSGSGARIAPPRQQHHAQRGVHDRGPAAAAAGPRHRAGEPVAERPRRAAGRRRADRLTSVTAAGRSSSACRRVPISSGSFDARFTLALDGQSEPLVPGMACDVKTDAL